MSMMSIAAVQNGTVNSPVVGASDSTGSTSGTSGTTDPNSLSGANANTFLQLLVAQLQYQDPDNPTDPTTMMSETASFEEVSQLDSMQTSLTSMAAASQVSMAASMLGQTVSGTDANGNAVTGVVSSVNLNSGNPLLTVGTSQMPLTNVTTLSQAGSAAGPAAATTT